MSVFTPVSVRMGADAPLMPALRRRSERVSPGAARRQPAVRRSSAMSRRERQQEQVVRALERGHTARALVLAREHLREYPDDVVVRDAAAKAERLMGGGMADE